MLELWMEGFVKYDVEMGSDVMIHVPCFIKIASGIHKLKGGYMYRHTAK
jgi:hypothetical protein